jgi:hypothetical protein
MPGAAAAAVAAADALGAAAVALALGAALGALVASPVAVGATPGSAMGALALAAGSVVFASGLTGPAGLSASQPLTRRHARDRTRRVRFTAPV